MYTKWPYYIPTSSIEKPSQIDQNGVLFENIPSSTKEARKFGLIFFLGKRYAFILTKMGWATFLVIFFLKLIWSPCFAPI
jgi:hypothetical protein